MPPRARPKSAPGADRDRAGRRPRTGSTAARRTSKVAAAPVERSAAAGTRPPAKGKPAPQPASSSSAGFTGRVAILVLVVAVLAVSYASSARAWLQQRSDISSLHSQIAQHRATIAALQQAERRWHDPAYIEAQARVRFGWVMPGQIGSRVIDAQGHVLSDGGSSLSQPTGAASPARPAWWQSAWGSVVEAGKSPTAPVVKHTRQPALWIGGNPHRQAGPSGKAPKPGSGNGSTPVR
jgi:cell division protein FtsB